MKDSAEDEYDRRTFAERWRRRIFGEPRIILIGFGVVLFALLVWATWPSWNAGRALRSGGAGPQPVGVASVGAGDLNVRLDALGTVTPLASVTVRPQVSGQIVKLDFQEGQMVKAGDVLAELDPRPFQAALEQTRGQLARDSAALANAKVDLDRFRSLWNLKAISQQQVANQTAVVKQDEGIVESDKANVQSAAINLGYAKVISPISGRVGLRQVDVGNLVQAGQANGIAVVTQLQPISVLFTLPEDDISQVMPRVNAAAALSIEAFDRNQIHKLASGSLGAVDTQVDPTTGTVKLRALFDNQDNALFPNQFVNVQVLVKTLHDQLIVPASAIQRGSQGTFVYVVNADNTVSVRTVTAGPSEGDRVSIAQGLKLGEIVVVDGADRLRDGAEVALAKGQHGRGAGSGTAGNGIDMTFNSRDARRALFLKLRRKMTPEERRAVRGMNKDDRWTWMKAHESDLMKRQDQPDNGGPVKE